jgi:hypothetical protein
MLSMLDRILGGQARNSPVIGSEPSAAMWRGKTGRSRISKFAADFFAAEIRAWHGEEPLWKVFWVYGVATSVVIVALYIVAVYDGRMALRQVLLPCFAAYTAWILVSVWRCASNTNEKLCGTLARFLTMAWAGNTILVLIFLQLNLLIKYLQH